MIRKSLLLCIYILAFTKLNKKVDDRKQKNFS